MPAIPKWKAPWDSFRPARCSWCKVPRKRGGAAGGPGRLAFITQTTLSVDDTAEIVGILRNVSRNRRAEQRRHLLRHDESPGGGEGDRAGERPGAGDRQPEFLQLPTAARGGGAIRRQAGHPAAPRGRAGLVVLEGVGCWALPLALGSGIAGGPAAGKLRGRFRLQHRGKAVTTEDVVFKLPVPLAS